ncbi:MAG: hypothetical protein PHE33_12080, partial [Bacteroidales bacterium]|nr:hypothetical protein [Bacteroidales bacterium]
MMKLKYTLLTLCLIVLSTFTNETLSQNNNTTDRACTTDAGTMTDLTPINLCADECTDMITHNDDDVLDLGDVLQFVVHNNSSPLIIYARSSDPEFCFSELQPGNYDVTYYISAIAGPDLGGGIVNHNHPCFSISQGVPITWFENPIAYISTPSGTSVCGLEITLNATAPASGMTGTWTSTGEFFAINGTTITNNTINVLANAHGDQTFRFTVNNGICSGYAEVLIHFIEIPNAYAGNDTTVCGNTVNLNAISSVTGSTGQWTGNGTFTNATNPITSVTANSFGEVSFTWREKVGTCWDEDIVKVTFIQAPNPTVTTLYDTVCGNVKNIKVSNAIYNGYWSAFTNGNPYSGVTYLPNNTSATTQVTIGGYPTNQHSRTVEFIWTETNQANSVQCTATATQYITFAQKPVASVGPVDNAEVCG